MYDLLETPKQEIQLAGGGVHSTVLSLIDEYGGEASIIMDDGCYVLTQRGSDGKYRTVKHWFPEAAKALCNILSTQVR